MENSWKEDIEFLFKTQKFTACDIWDLKGNSICCFKEKDKLKQDVTAFLDYWQKQRFKCVFRTATTQSIENGFIHFIDTRIVEEQKIANVPIQGAHISEQDIELRVQKQIDGILEKRDFEETKKQVYAQKESLEQVGDKVAVLIERIFYYFQPALQNITQPIQGDTGMSMEVKDTETTSEMVQQALQILVENVEPDALIKIAEKVKSDPSVVNKILPFL